MLLLGALGRITESEDDEREPFYAQGINNVTIVKVTCGRNITLALSRNSQLYISSIFKVWKDIDLL